MGKSPKLTEPLAQAIQPRSFSAGGHQATANYGVVRWVAWFFFFRAKAGEPRVQGRVGLFLVATVPGRRCTAAKEDRGLFMVLVVAEYWLGWVCLVAARGQSVYG